MEVRFPCKNLGACKNYLKKKKPAIQRLIKIDVEGMETNVVLGAMRAIYQLPGNGGRDVMR